MDIADAGTIRSQIASAIHFVIQLNRMADGKRRITAISEITAMEGDVITMQDIFVFRRRGISAEGEVLGEFTATGIRPRCVDLLAAAGVEFAETHFMVRE
jgi:pilus assembly protein CpaF